MKTLTGSKRLCQLKTLFAVCGLADHGDPRCALQELFYGLSKRKIVIDDQ